MTRIAYLIEKHSLMRMIGWLPAGLLFYALSIYVGTDNPQVQLVLWKLGHACTFSWLGYWIARQVSGSLQAWRDVDTMHEGIVYAARILARAVLVAAVLMVANGI